MKYSKKYISRLSESSYGEESEEIADDPETVLMKMFERIQEHLMNPTPIFEGLKPVYGYDGLRGSVSSDT